MKWILLFALPYLVAAQGDGDPLDQETPTAPPTSQFQGPESGYIIPIPEGHGPQINQDRVVDFNYCYASLARNDVNSDGRLKRAEFENFAQDFGGGTECLGKLEALPLELLTVWNQLSCECAARGGASDCCLGSNGNIPITGVDPSDEFLVAEQQYLRQVCLRTDQAIITYCGPPPPPIIPPPPPAFFATPRVAASSNPAALITGIVFAIILLCCPWRRRWIFLFGGKPDDESESSEEPVDDESDAGGMHHLVTEQPADLEAGAAAAPDDTLMQLRAIGEEEDGEFGGASYGRTVEEPEYEEEGAPKKFVYQQYENPVEPEDPMKLNPIPVPVKMEEDEPYDLEHYVPDGGIVEYEREGEWRYDADGGWTPQEREGKKPVEFGHHGYERAAPVVVPVVDNRRDRHLESYGDAAIFDRLALEPDIGGGGGGGGDMFDWVIQSTLDTLDERGEDLQGSAHSSDDSSRGSGR
jgi:hypothetical protein